MESLLIAFLLLIAGLSELHAQYDKDVFYMRGRRALADGKYALAIENFNILTQLDTTDHWTFFFRGIAKYNLGDLRGAKSDFDRSVRINPVFTSGYHYKGITDSRFGDYESALNNLNKAISLRPGNTGLYFSRGVTYFLSQQFEKSVDDFNRYIRKEPKDPTAYLNRGAGYLFLGDTLKALNDYNKAVEQGEAAAEGRQLQQFEDYYTAFYYMNRGVLRADMIEFIASIESNVQVLSMDDSGNTRARVKDQVSRSYDYDDAISDMETAAQIMPDLPYLYFNLGNLYCLSKEHVKSIENYTKAIELYGYMGDAYFNRGLVLIYLKDKDKGCVDLSRAGELGVQDAYSVIKKYCEDKNE
jgi:tetratricopeptide (TPR) repeat protein